MNSLSSLLRMLALAMALIGCAKSPEPVPAPAAGHAHLAPHGGTLVELGEELYHLELVRDPEAGKLAAYVLDGHAENFIRIAAPSFDLVALADGARRPLTLRAVANTATGETVGDTSQFEAQADWLKKNAPFTGTLTALEVRGTKFANVAFSLQKPEAGR